MTSTSTIPLEDLNPNGTPPVTRMTDPQKGSDLLTQFLRADETRNATRAKLRGLVDGNPPYSPAKLKAAGRANDTNVNFRGAEMFVAMAAGAFYDVFSEAPTYATVRTSYGTDPNKRQEWSNIITEEFDRLQKRDRTFDYMMQLSQREMVLMGCGPIMFQDDVSWKSCKAITELYVPDKTEADTANWEVALVRSQFTVSQLWTKIRDFEAAKAIGWDVEACKRAIIEAQPESTSDWTKQYDWEKVQQELRSNDITFSARCKVVMVSHIFYQEFDGKISHRILNERDNSAWLFTKLRRFTSWDRVIHPFYYDRGDGEHHGVKGLGIKMYPAIELQNRLRCALMDAAFSNTQIMLQPTNAQALNVTNVVQMGPYSILPPDYQVVQRQVAGVMDASMAAITDLENVVQNNVSQYRQQLSRPSGNPRTATEIQALVAQASALGATQLTRYYEQLDGFFAERYRRAANKNVTEQDDGGNEALEFQRRCIERGVPEAAMSGVESVQATRTVGQGSAFVKQQKLQAMMQVLPQLPPSGQMNLLSDFIASQASQSMVARYLPEPMTNAKEQDQIAYAQLEAGLMKSGVSPLVTDTQSHELHVQKHLQDANDAAESITQGAPPADIGQFLTITVQHVTQHLQRLMLNPNKQGFVQQAQAQLEQLVQVAQQVEQFASEQAQQVSAQGQQPQVDMEAQMRAGEAQQKIARDNALAQAQIEATRAETAARIRRENALAQADIAAKALQTRSKVAAREAQETTPLV